MATIRLPEALTSSAPVSRRAFATTLGAGGLAIAAIASAETLLARRPFALARTSPSSNHGSARGAVTGAWSLTVTRGAVSLDLTPDVLDRFETVSRVVAEAGKPGSTFGGVALADLLSAVGAGAGARVRATSTLSGRGPASVVLTPAQAAAPSTMIATIVDGRLLTPDDGGPARLVAPRVALAGRLTRIEVLG